MKHSKVWAPPAVRRVRIREKTKIGEYLRNNRTNTSIAAFSTRATPRGPVSVPLGWHELTAATTPDRFAMVTVPKRLARLRRDPWADY